MNVITLILISIITLSAIVYFINLAQEPKAIGLVEGKLQFCPDKPNCINTEYPDKLSQFLPPLDYPATKVANVHAISKKLIIEMGGEIINEDKHYISAIFKSKLFRFVDDCVPRRRIEGRSPSCSYAA